MTVFNKAKELVEQYNKLFEPYGIYITVKHSFYEKEVETYKSNSNGSGGSFINALEYLFINRHKEKKYGKVPNRYRYLTIQVSPLDKQILPQHDIKQYSFLLKKTERAHQGQEPTETTVSDLRILKKLEKCLQKLLKKGRAKAKKLWYRNDFWDCLRYTFMPRYNYLEFYCGKEKIFWDILIPVLIGIFFVIFIAVVYIIVN